MSVVAPLSATAAAVPVVFGIATGDRPSALQLAGIAARRRRGDLRRARAAERASRCRPRPDPGCAAGAALGLVAALGFGCFFVAMDAASDGDVFWAILVNRITGVSLLVVAALATRSALARRPTRDRHDRLDRHARHQREHALRVRLDRGLVSIVAVVSSLYPIVTILLARAVLKERIARTQGRCGDRARGRGPDHRRLAQLDAEQPLELGQRRVGAAVEDRGHPDLLGAGAVLLQVVDEDAVAPGRGRCARLPGGRSPVAACASPPRRRSRRRRRARGTGSGRR